MTGDDVRILVATQPIDFRAGINRLVSLISQALGSDPYDGQLYVFRSKRNDRLKAIRFDGSGVVLATKWLEVGKFHWPPVRDGAMARWRDGAMARWRDGAMARWRDGDERGAICRLTVRAGLEETGNEGDPKAQDFRLKAAISLAFPAVFVTLRSCRFAPKTCRATSIVSSRLQSS